MQNINENRFCNLCPNHCYTDELRCNKGRRLFGEKELSGKEERRLQKTGAHRDHKNPHADRESVIGLLRICGHILYHQRAGGRGQERIFSILMENPRISQKRVQDMMEIQSGSISELVNKMEKKGFLRRERDEDDKRKINLILTQKGKDSYKESGIKEIETSEMLRVLSKSEQDELKIILKKLVEDWEERY